MDKQFVSPKEAAEMLGISKDTLAQWRCARKGPDFFKLGTRVRYRLTDLEKWLEAQRHECENS